MEEQDGIQHYFIDSHQLEDEVTAAQYEKEALAVLEKEFNAHDYIILTGGSGMFIDALCIGLDNIPASKEMKATITAEYEKTGIEPLLLELKLKDPDYFVEVDQHNPMRIMRAIEVIRLTNKSYSSLRQREPAKRPFTTHRFVIDHEREKLYERINLRVDLMMKAGLLDEVKSVVDKSNLSSLNTVGYKEIFEHLKGECSLDEAIEKIKMNTRRYAKRQLTWFRRHEDAVWIKYTDQSTMTQEIMQHL